MNLTEWAKAQGIHPQTARRWFREGTMSVPAMRVGPRTILVNVEANQAVGGVGLYARVSSHDQKADLERQTTRLVEWAAKAGHRVVRVESEVASGMNGSRAKVRRLLAEPSVTMVVVEHKDRLGRMNVELVQAALAAHGRRLVLLDEGEVEADLVRDMTEVLTSFWTVSRGSGSGTRRSASPPTARSASSCPSRWSTWRTRREAGTSCPAGSPSHTGAMSGQAASPGTGRSRTRSTTTRSRAAGS